MNNGKTFQLDNNITVNFCTTLTLGTPEECPELTTENILQTVKEEAWAFSEVERKWVDSLLEDYYHSETNWAGALLNLEDIVKKLYGIQGEDDNIYTLENYVGYPHRGWAWEILSALKGHCVHEAGVSEKEWEKRLMNALPTKYVLREYQYSGTMGKMYFLEPLFNEEEDTSGTFSPERFRH